MSRAAAKLNENVDDSDEDEEQGTVAHVSVAFERTYRDERSWEVLAEDEHGRLVASRTTNKLKRQRTVQDTSRVRRGLIRYVKFRRWIRTRRVST